MDMVIITICAVICGADEWEAVTENGEVKTKSPLFRHCWKR